MKRYEKASLPVMLIHLAGFGCGGEASLDVDQLAATDVAYTRHDLVMHQELINDAPIGPGEPQLSDHCPTAPGRWFAGSGRSTGTSTVFGDLSEVEVYCVNRDRAELSGGLATWIDVDGDTVSMSFGAKLLRGGVYTPTPNATMVGFAQFTGGTGKWTGVTGAAFLTGRQNGDGTTTLRYQGTVYLPR